MSIPEPPAATLAEVAVVDYGLGNLRSVTRGLERAGAAVTITDDPEAFAAADGVVLPGVGAFREGMENAAPYRDALVDHAAAGRPLFGICLGMQMLLTDSEEADRAGQGEVRGLDLVPGTNRRFDGDQKVPHMGWNELDVVRDHPLVDGVNDEKSAGEDGPGGGTATPTGEDHAGSADGAVDAADGSGDDPAPHPADGRSQGGSVDGEHAYFVHSYYPEPDDDAAVVATTDHGRTFPSIVANESGNVFGTQFHPEKSGAAGLRLLRNFVDYCAAER